MTISQSEITELATCLFETVHNCGSPQEQARFFVGENPVIYLMNTGDILTLEENQKMAGNFVNQKHILGEIFITPLPSEQERVRVISSVYWEAPHKGAPSKAIKAVCDFDWIIERVGKELKFVIYMITSRHLLPDSQGFEVEELAKS